MLLVHSHSKPLHEKSSHACYVVLTVHLPAQDSTYYVLATLEAREIGSLCDFWGTHRFSHCFSDCHQVLSLKNPVFYTLIPSPLLVCVYIYVFLFFIFLHPALFDLSSLLLKLYKHNYKRFWFLETNVQKFSLHKCYGEILYTCDFFNSRPLSNTLKETILAIPLKALLCTADHCLCAKKKESFIFLKELAFLPRRHTKGFYLCYCCCHCCFSVFRGV